MATYTGPKVRLSRQSGVPISENPKHTNSRRLDTKPGGSTKRMRRLSDYGVRLKEKQKLRYYYNVKERQFVRCLKEATRRKGNTGENLLEILERRLDNVVRRVHFARSIWQARQIVNHEHVLVNGKPVNIPSYQVKPGDVVSVRDKSKEWIGRTVELLGTDFSHDWITFDKEKLSATITAVPKDASLPFDINMGMIIEYYS